MRLATFFKTFAFGGPVAASSCRIFSSSAVIPIYKLLRVLKTVHQKTTPLSDTMCTTMLKWREKGSLQLKRKGRLRRINIHRYMRETWFNYLKSICWQIKTCHKLNRIQYKWQKLFPMHKIRSCKEPSIHNIVTGSYSTAVDALQPCQRMLSLKCWILIFVSMHAVFRYLYES